jgi:HD-GYP domain-containing protein (c-di-GMP phosphodiesterase class II)
MMENVDHLKKAIPYILYHHEWWNGNGYPSGLKGEKIPREGRLLAIADAFDAIRIPEVSNPVARNQIALRIIRVASGTQFDPELVEALWLIRESIPGSDIVESTASNCFDSWR